MCLIIYGVCKGLWGNRVVGITHRSFYQRAKELPVLLNRTSGAQYPFWRQ